MADANLINSAALARVQDIGFVHQFEQGVTALLAVLDIAEPQVLRAGTQVQMYTVTGNLTSDTVAEGEDIPLSKYVQTKGPSYTVDLEEWRKATTAQAILKFGDEGANTIIRAMAFAVDGPSYRSSQRLRSVEIPSWVTQVDYRAFYYSAITSLPAPGDTVLTLGQGVFMYATGLTALSVERPVELYSYGSQFSMCTGLASVDQEIRAKSGTTYVPGNCFSGCTALASVRLRSTATSLSVATRAFGGCTALMVLVLDYGAVASLTNTSLTGVPDGCAIYVRDALVDSYRAAANWSARADHILPLSGWEGA